MKRLIKRGWCDSGLSFAPPVTRIPAWPLHDARGFDPIAQPI